MNHDLTHLGDPHLKLAAFKLWVHGYQYPDCDDYWDGNWLRATAICSENGATVQISGAFIRNTEIADWHLAVEKIGINLAGEARLECMEPDLAVGLKFQPLGAVEMTVEISPDHLSQEHRFVFLIDQSYLARCHRNASDCCKNFQYGALDDQPVTSWLMASSWNENRLHHLVHFILGVFDF